MYYHAKYCGFWQVKPFVFRRRYPAAPPCIYAQALDKWRFRRIYSEQRTYNCSPHEWKEFSRRTSYCMNHSECLSAAWCASQRGRGAALLSNRGEKDDPERRCFQARLRHEPQEAMYGCLCLYRPQLWKASVLFTVKGCDGPSSEKGPLCPSFCVDVCVYMSGVGVGGLYIWSKLWGPNCFAWWNLPHSPHLGLCVCQQLVCECVCGYGITYPLGMFLYKGQNIRKKNLTCLLSWETYKIKQKDNQCLTETDLSATVESRGSCPYKDKKSGKAETHIAVNMIILIKHQPSSAAD